MKIRNLRTNHLTNPMGYAMEKPLFTWTAEDSTGLKQRAARVQVSLSERFDECLFDSGLTEGISSLGYEPELTLSPRTRYFWRVEVVADDGDRAVSEPAWFETGKCGEPWAAQWIQSPYDKDVHSILGTTVTLPAAPVRARIYAVGLGTYELTVNGEKVGDEILAPFYNDYNLWLQYQTYDVTDMLRAGENRLDAWLGNGWYKGRFGFVPEMANLYGDRQKALVELRVEMADGSELVVGSDAGWDARRSPILESSIYDGEVYDARLESEQPTDKAVLAEAPAAPLSERLSPPVRILDRIPAKELLHTKAGEWVIDFGQLMTGWLEFNCDLPEGAKVYLQFGELLQNDCFYRDNLRSAKAEYTYISAGRPAHVRPHFTFYGFRFVKVTGVDSIRLEDFTGCVIHSDLAVIGHVETSNAKVNQLIHNAFWGQIGNFLDTPTDCPQRDERMGWTGDAEVFCPTASFNMYTPAFYEKYLHDMLLEQRRLDGAVPHVVPDILDQIASIRHEPQGAFGSCAWGDAATMIPWTMYEFYGDKSMLARQYENMKLWANWIRKQDDEHCGSSRLWTSGFHFADWLALDNPVQGSCFGGTDPYYVASCYYFFSVSATAQAAKALGYAEDYAEYSRLADEIKAAFRREYFTDTGRIAEPTQTAMALALSLGLAPDEARARIQKDLRKKIADRQDHLDTGFVGTYHLCPTLSKNGMSDVAYTLLLNEDFPSWLYEVNMGATTVWERWNSVLPDGLVSDTGMNSMNHYAYGAIVEWMYRFMCGLNPVLEQPGFKRARIAPVSDPRFEFARCTYDSAAGLYESGWKRVDGKLVYTVKVPFDCEADFVPELADAQWTVNGRPAAPHDGKITLTAGEYTIAQA